MPDKIADIARFIDHTLLKPDATPAQVEQSCAEAREYRFATVCVNSCHVPLCRRLMDEGGQSPAWTKPVGGGQPPAWDTIRIEDNSVMSRAVRVCTVIGFPLGAMLREAKAAEAALAVKLGADELDMVMNVGWLKAGEDRLVLADIRQVVDAANGRPVKVIIETCLLTDAEKERATALVVEAGAAFVKTSTGFSMAGATVADVALLARVAAGRVGVKASGGVRDYATAVQMIQAGATRIGTSSGVAIVRAANEQGK
jgi:deoxyribose-phosphate aldolase